MKVPPKRKGNLTTRVFAHAETRALNESPSEKEGKLVDWFTAFSSFSTLNESPSEKEGKYPTVEDINNEKPRPSMKVPPKRKGNPTPQ